MRRGQAEKRDIAPDLKYKNPTVAKFVNYVLLKRKQKKTL